MNEFLHTSRRDFLRLAGAGVTGAAASATLAAGPAPLQGAVVVHDPDFSVPAEFVAGLQGQGSALLVALNGDPVRLWRDGLRDSVARGGALYGLTLGADLLIFRGLAAELRRHLRVVRQDPVSGRFAWMIA